MTYAKIISESAIDRNPPRHARLPNGRTVAGELPADYLATLGYYPLDESPAPAEPPAPGMHWEARYALAEGRIAQSWAQVADPPPAPRSLSKRRLYRALSAAGLWEPVKGYMEQAGVWEDFALATTLDEDDPLIVAAVAALQAQLGLDDATVAGLLDESVAEE